MTGNLRNYRVKVNSRVYAVTIEQTTVGHFRGSLDGDIFEMDLVGKDAGLTWSLRRSEKAVRAHAKILQNDVVETWLAGIPYSASVQPLGLTGYMIQPEKTTELPHGGEIRALMPGRVTSILANQNDRVEVGTPILILEAMKMQNEISSPISGRVKSIRVKEGETVKKDALLMEIG